MLVFKGGPAGSSSLRFVLQTHHLSSHCHYIFIYSVIMLLPRNVIHLASLLLPFLPLIPAASLPVSASALEKRYASGTCSVYIKQKLYNYSGQKPKPSPAYKLLISVQLFDDAKKQIGGDDTLRDTFFAETNDEYSQLPYVMVFYMINNPKSTSHTDVSFSYADDSWSSADSRCVWDSDTYNTDSAGTFYLGGVRCSFKCASPPASGLTPTTSGLNTLPSLPALR